MQCVVPLSYDVGTHHEQACSAQSKDRPGDIYHPDFLHEKPAYFDVLVRNSFHLVYAVTSAVEPSSATETGEMERDSLHDSDVSSCGGLFYPLALRLLEFLPLRVWKP